MDKRKGFILLDKIFSVFTISVTKYFSVVFNSLSTLEYALT